MDYQKQYKAKYRADPANKEKERQYAKQWREANASYINERIECSKCGFEISRNSIYGHLKTQRCMESHGEINK